MKTTSILFASGALLLGFGATSTFAQTAGKPVEQHPAPKNGAPVQTTSSDPAMHMSAEAPALASKLIGTEIVDSAGKELAEIKDLMIADDGEVVACVERKDDLMLCVPLTHLEARLTKSDTPEAKAKERSAAVMSGETPDIKQFAFKGDRALFDSAPGVKDAKMLDHACMQRSMDHFAGRMSAEPKTDASKPMGEHDAAMAATKPCCVKKLLGQDVKGTDGDKVGDVKDLAIDLNSSHVAYAIVSTGGVLGVGDKHHAVAFDRLTWNDGSVTIPMTKDGASKLPDLDLDRLPANPTGIASAHRDMPADRGTDRKGN